MTENSVQLPKLIKTNETDSVGTPIFELDSYFFYQLGPTSVVVVPRGFRTNFGTIPRWLHWWIHPLELGEAAIVHDFMCNEDWSGDDSRVRSGYSRWMADCTLYEVMARMGFSWVKRASVFLAVRLSVLWKKVRYPELSDDEKVEIQ